METPSLKMQGYSAHVHMELRLSGHILPIAQMAPGFIVLRETVDHSPTDAEIYLRIDDSESSWRVHLDEGISTDRRKTRVSPVQRSARGPTLT